MEILPKGYKSKLSFFETEEAIKKVLAEAEERVKED